MAEFAATLITLVGLGGTSIAVSSALYRLAREVKTSNKDIKLLGMRFRIVGDSLRLVKSQFQDICAKPESSTVIQYLEDNRLAKHLSDMCQLLTERMQDFASQLRRLPTENGIGANIRRTFWVIFKKPEIKELHPEIEFVMSTITMLMSAVQLEVAMERGTDADTM
jgi:hypothetical protein